MLMFGGLLFMCLCVYSWFRVGVQVGVMVARAPHRVHLPTLGLDGQVYVCMCMGRYSV